MKIDLLIRRDVLISRNWESSGGRGQRPVAVWHYALCIMLPSPPATSTAALPSGKNLPARGEIASPADEGQVQFYRG